MRGFYFFRCRMSSCYQFGTSKNVERRISEYKGANRPDKIIYKTEEDGEMLEKITKAFWKARITDAAMWDGFECFFCINAAKMEKHLDDYMIFLERYKMFRVYLS